MQNILWKGLVYGMKYWLNPLLQKEMKVKAGLRQLLVGIVLYELFLAAIAFFGFRMVFNIHWNRFVDYSGAVYVYLILAGLETMMVLVTVPAFAARSIAQEREKKTLEVLLTTVMSPGQVVAGKLFSAISVPILLVVASLPVLSVVFTVGGVTKGHLVLFVAIIMWEAVFIGSIGVFLSAVLRRTEQAVMMSYVVSLGLCVGTAAVVAVVCLIRQLYVWNVLQGGGRLDVGWTVFLLLFNPVVTVADMLGRQLGYTGEIYGLAKQLGGISKFILQHWWGLSILFQFLLTILFLSLAKRALKNSGE